MNCPLDNKDIKMTEESFCLDNEHAGPPFSCNTIEFDHARDAVKLMRSTDNPYAELGFIVDLLHIKQLMLEIEIYNSKQENKDNPVNSLRIYKGRSRCWQVKGVFKETIFLAPASNSAMDLIGILDVDNPDSKQLRDNFSIVGEARPCPKLCNK